MVPSAIGKLPEIKSMLVIHQGALGDFILALPALATLRKTFPQAKSVIMGYPRILQLAAGRFYAEEIVSIDQRGMATFFVQEGALDLSLSQFFKAFDLIVVFGKNRGGTLIKNLKKVAKQYVLDINPFPKWDEGVHLSDHLLGQLTSYGISTLKLNPKLYLNESDQAWGRSFWEGKGLNLEERAKVIILHPGSGSKKKVWPLEKFSTLIQYLQPRIDSKFLIVLGPAEGPEVQKAFEGMKGNGPMMAKGLSLLQLASVMEGCRLFIGNDSGISHLAAALGLPTLAIFGPTDPRVWSPRGEKAVVVRRGIPCSPCSEERFFICKKFECLAGIEKGDVLKGLMSLGVKV